jgi:hypothetical protein
MSLRAHSAPVRSGREIRGNPRITSSRARGRVASWVAEGWDETGGWPRLRCFGPSAGHDSCNVGWTSVGPLEPTPRDRPADGPKRNGGSARDVSLEGVLEENP